MWMLGWIWYLVGSFVVVVGGRTVYGRVQVVIRSVQVATRPAVTAFTRGLTTVCEQERNCAGPRRRGWDSECELFNQIRELLLLPFERGSRAGAILPVLAEGA